MFMSYDEKRPHMIRNREEVEKLGWDECSD